MPSLRQLETALINADRAGDADAARKLAAEVKRYRQAGITDADPNEGMSGFEKGAVSLGRSFDKTLRGIGEIGLAAADKVGIGPGPEAMQAESQRRDELWNKNATGRMKGGELVADIAQFAVPATGAAKATAGAGMLARAGAQSGAAMGLDAVQQQGEGQEGIDAGRTAMTGAFAGGAEFMAPVLGRAYNAIKGKIRSNNPAEIGRAIGKQLGLDEVPDELAVKLAQAADEIDAGARPGAVLAEKEFGFNLTRGQKTGRHSDLSKEDLLRPTNQGRQIRQMDDFNQSRQQELVEQMSGGLDSPQSAVDDVQAAVKGARDTAKQGADEAWKFARNSDLIVDGSLADDFARNVDEAFKSSGRIVNENIAGSAKSAIDEIDNVLRTAVDETGGIDFKKIEEARKMFSTNYGSMSDGASRGAFRIARQEFDRTLDDLTEATILSGNIDDIQKLKDAIGVSREVFKKFSAAGSKDKIGKTVENILENGNLDDLSAAVLGSAEVAPRAGANFARAVKRTLGQDAPELQKVKQAVLLKAATRKTGDANGMQKFSSNIKSLLNTRKDLMKELYSTKEIAQLGRLTQALDAMTIKPGTIGRSSGTAERALRAIESASTDNLLAPVFKVAGWLGRRRLAKGVTAPLRTNPTAPLLPATAGATQSTRQ